MRDLGHILVAAAENAPNAIAIVDGDDRFTYAQWTKQVAGLAGGLARRGAQPGDRILCALQNRWEAAALYWACQLGGFVFAPVNWRVSASELDHYLTDSGACLLVHEAVSADAVAGSQAAQRVRAVSVDEGGAAGPASFAALLAGEDQIGGHADPENISILLYTSGTTGRPKGVPRRHRMEHAAAQRQIAINELVRGDVALGCMPLFHTMGIRALVCAAYLQGTFVCMRRFDAQHALDLIASERVTHLGLVPTMYHDMVELPSASAADLSSVDRLMSAGAPLTQALLDRLGAIFTPARIVNQYGSTEIYVSTFESAAAARPGSVGKPSAPTSIRVVQIEATDPTQCVRRGEEGQVIVSLDGEDAFEGYWHLPEADEKAIRDRWYFTGDLGHQNAEGDLFVTGRVDDLIISGGENISPVEIENKLMLYPGIAEAVVVGLPDPRLGQAVTAAVRAVASIDPRELDQFCRKAGLPGYKCPKRYIFVHEIPRSPSGKILRRKLISQLAGL